VELKILNSEAYRLNRICNDKDIKSREENTKIQAIIMEYIRGV